MTDSQQNWNSSVCYFPDGRSDGRIDPPFVPCDPLAAASACCAIGESCVGNGLCYSDAGGIYRGACTDSTWEAEACSTICIAEDGPRAGYQTAYQFLIQCLQSDGSTPWSCLNTEPCSAGNLFDLYVYAIQHLNITGFVEDASELPAASTSAVGSFSGTRPTSSVSGDGASPASVESSPETSSCSASTQDMIAVGAGVGVPLFVLLLAALAGMFVYRRKWVRGKDGSVQTNQMERAPASFVYAKEQSPSELSARHSRRSELPVSRVQSP